VILICELNRFCRVCSNILICIKLLLFPDLFTVELFTLVSPMYIGNIVIPLFSHNYIYTFHANEAGTKAGHCLSSPLAVGVSRSFRV